MTLEQAVKVKQLLTLRDSLLSQLRDLDKCDSISGHINEGGNGLGFRWNNNSWQIKCLIEGIKKEIQSVEETILKL